MSSDRILVVEDDLDIANMLRIYFGGQGYDVQVATTGEAALLATRQQIPGLIILDINLPDISGFDVCRDLRTTTRTRHIPVIFLTQKDERSDKIIGLELGADDYVTKPFDIEELKLRVQNAIAASRRQTQLDPRSNLPTGQLIEEHLRALMSGQRPWAYLDLKISNFESFCEVYGWAAGDEVIRSTAIMIGEVIDELGTPDDFVGHPGRDNFVVISHAVDTMAMADRLVQRFDEGVQRHYSFIDRERGYMLVPVDEAVVDRIPLMTLLSGVVSTRTHRFSDIREVIELAANERRRHRNAAGSDGEPGILTSW